MIHSRFYAKVPVDSYRKLAANAVSKTDIVNGDFISLCFCLEQKLSKKRLYCFNPLRPNSDLTQTSHCTIKGLSVSEVMRIENMITQVKFY